MTRKIGMLVLGVVLVFALVFGGWGCAKPAPAPAPKPAPAPAPAPKPAPAPEVIKWRLQGGFPPKAPFTAVLYKTFMELVKEKGKGRLEIERFNPGEILAPTEIFKGVSDGVVELGGSVGAYHSRLLPEASVEFGLPCTITSNDQFYDFVYKYKDGAFFKTVDEAYRGKGIHLLAMVGYANALMTNFPVNKLEDLDGKKMRCVGDYAKAIEAFGAKPVNLPAAEEYTALQRGTVDGTVQSIQTIIGFKVLEVAKYVILPPVGFAAGDLFCNVEAFNKLPADLQKVVEEAAREAALNTFGPGYPAREKANLDAGKKAGMQVITLSDAEFAKMRAAASPILDEAAARSPRCATLVDMLKSYLK